MSKVEYKVMNIDPDNSEQLSHLEGSLRAGWKIICATPWRWKGTYGASGEHPRIQYVMSVEVSDNDG